MLQARSFAAVAFFALLAPAATIAATPRQPIVDRVVIYKAGHRLEAWSGRQLLKTYRIAIGSGGAGHKRMEGDNRTPVGRYEIVNKRPSHKFHLFLLLSYPNAADRAAFAQAKKQKRLPADARIGGAIGIHGEKRGWSWLPHKWIDWTQGCIAVDDDEIEELYSRVRVGTRVEIFP